MMSDNFWSSKHTWGVSANNTKWCLIGCAIGDFGTIAVMQDSGVSVLIIFALAMLNGIIVSILLETYMLMRQSIRFGNAIRTALGMSLISMLSMELAMNLVDYLFTGGGDISMVSITDSLIFWIYNPMALQLLAIKKIR